MGSQIIEKGLDTEKSRNEMSHSASSISRGFGRTAIVPFGKYVRTLVFFASTVYLQVFFFFSGTYSMTFWYSFLSILGFTNSGRPCWRLRLFSTARDRSM